MMPPHPKFKVHKLHVNSTNCKSKTRSNCALMQNTQRSCSIGTMKLFDKLKEELEDEEDELAEMQGKEESDHLAGSYVTTLATLFYYSKQKGNMNKIESIENNIEHLENHFEINSLDLDLLDLDEHDNDNLKIAIELLHSFCNAFILGLDPEVRRCADKVNAISKSWGLFLPHSNHKSTFETKRIV